MFILKGYVSSFSHGLRLELRLPLSRAPGQRSVSRKGPFAPSPRASPPVSAVYRQVSPRMRMVMVRGPSRAPAPGALRRAARRWRCSTAGRARAGGRAGLAPPQCRGCGAWWPMASRRRAEEPLPVNRLLRQHPNAAGEAVAAEEKVMWEQKFKRWL